jgi:hypothetical protein
MGLSVDDVREVVRACAHVRVPERPPPYFQQFLVLRLQDDHPSLAETIARLTPEQCATLFRAVREFQAAAQDF